MKFLGQIGRLLIGALVIVFLLPNTLTVISTGIAVFTTTSSNPSGRLGYFFGALVMELVLILVLKRIVLRRPAKTATQ